MRRAHATLRLLQAIPPINRRSCFIDAVPIHIRLHLEGLGIAVGSQDRLAAAAARHFQHTGVEETWVREQFLLIYFILSRLLLNPFLSRPSGLTGAHTTLERGLNPVLELLRTQDQFLIQGFPNRVQEIIFHVMPK